MERRADEAERELVQWKKVRFMADKVGEEFEGYVTGVAAFGLFVELVEHFVEGLVHVSSMADDYYRFLERAHVADGESTRKAYRLGDRVRVQVVRVDLERRQIDLGLVEILDGRPGVRAGPRSPPIARDAESRIEAGDARVTAKTGDEPAPRPARARRAFGREAPVAGTMRHVIVGTAGHIDHGKSTLVRALTGIDPDRLKEEKARGITIDLGFAHDVRGDVTLAFVDVPGHERFVKNMLAGATGIDVLLLVVAADESVMPQTREHFDICRLLQVRAGVIALTKADLVDRETLDLVTLEARELVAGSFLEAAPVVAVSARSGAGLDELRAALLAAAEQAPAHRRDGAFRLPVDRVFSIKGFGTVVTGTVMSGQVGADETLEVQPAGRRVKVRGLQGHGATVSSVGAGQRAAINLAAVEVEDLQRGDSLVAPGSLGPTRRLDASLEVLPSARPIKHGARVRFHQGTIEVLGRVAVSQLVGPEAGTARAIGEIPPGARAHVRLRLEAPVVVTRGDRFVLRAYSPPITVAGGAVLDPRPARGAIRTAEGRRRFSRLGSRCACRVRRDGQHRSGSDHDARRAGGPGAGVRAAGESDGPDAWRRAAGRRSG